MRYAKIRKYDIANGVGIRTSFFITGCDRACKSCFNEEYMNPLYGKVWTDDETKILIDYLTLEEVEGLSILGGEPFESALSLLKVLEQIRKKTDKSIWIYSGFTYEILEKIPLARKILSLVDVLIDGEFKEDLKDLSLPYRGSSNQRIIDTKESLKKNKVILLDGYK